MENKRERARKRKNYLEEVSLPIDRNFRNVFSITGLALIVDAFQSLFTGESFVYGKPSEQVLNYIPYAFASLIPLGGAKLSELGMRYPKKEVKALEYGLNTGDFDHLGVIMASEGPTNLREAFSDFFHGSKKDKRAKKPYQNP